MTKSILQFQWKYFALTIILFAIEIFIAVYVHDRIIRPYIGDLLVVILIYCFLKSFLIIPTTRLAISVLLFSYLVEVLQYFHFIKLLGLQNYPIARIILGTSFEWIDLLSYTIGIGLVLLFEGFISKRKEAKRDNHILQ